MTARLVHDRDGSVIGEDVPDPTAVAHRCRRGWLSGPDDDQPRPCPRCRPWLRERRPPTRQELEAVRAHR